MTPNDFLTFRDHLMPASGFQSAAFRSMEFRCGLKEARHLDNYAEGAPARTELERRLAEPTVGEAFYAMLRRRGFSLPASGVGGNAADGDEGADDDALREVRIRSLLSIYQDPGAHYDLYLLAEALVEFDESFSLWRLHHVAMVERMIGSKPGTGGSAGVGYLRTTLGRKFFPELWELRSYLSVKTGP
jgi:tryptophan 2,3-dioxygenase